MIQFGILGGGGYLGLYRWADSSRDWMVPLVVFEDGGRDHEPRNEAQEARKDKERGIFSLKKTYIGFHPVKAILDLGLPDM